MNTYKYRIRLSAVSLLVCIPVLANWFYQIRPESASGRVLIWKSSYAMFNEHSLSGVGIDNFPGFYPFYQAKVLEDQTTNDRYGVFAGEIEYAFNDVLHTFAEVGIIGGMIYLWIILQSLYNINQFLKRNDPTDYRFITTTSLSAGIIVIVIAGMTAYPIQMLPIKLWFWLLIGVINAITTEQNNFKRVNLPNTVFYSNVLLLTSIAIFYSIFGFKKVNGYLLWQKNKKEMEAVEISEMAHFTPFMGNDAFYLKDLGFKYAEAGNNDIAELYFEKSISRKFSKDYYYILGKHYEKMGEYDKALFQYQLIESAIPHLIKPKYLQAMVYYELGNIELFEQVAEDLMLTDPKVYNLNVDQMKREIGFLRSRLHNKQD